MIQQEWRAKLNGGLAIPASPLALDHQAQWSPRHQRALTRYYIDAGAGGIAVGVHTTQFAIRDHGLLKPVLREVAQTINEWIAPPDDFVRIAGVCGETAQAISEAELAKSFGYQAGLLSTTAIKHWGEHEILSHCRRVAEVIPIFGFYLQPAVGGRVFSYEYWRQFCEIEQVIAIKIAPFNRYQTIDVVRAVVDSGRTDIAIYTGNDDNIIADLLTPYRFNGQTRFIQGGLLGQWAVWTRAAVALLERIKSLRLLETVPIELLSANANLTDANAAVFDAANEFAGCIPGVNEVLRRQGLLPSTRCLDSSEVLSPGQSEQIDRVSKQFTAEDEFVAANLERWLG